MKEADRNYGIIASFFLYLSRIQSPGRKDDKLGGLIMHWYVHRPSLPGVHRILNFSAVHLKGKILSLSLKGKTGLPNYAVEKVGITGSHNQLCSAHHC